MDWKVKKCATCAFKNYVFLTSADEAIPCSSCIGGSNWENRNEAISNYIEKAKRELIHPDVNSEEQATLFRLSKAVKYLRQAIELLS